MRGSARAAPSVGRFWVVGWVVGPGLRVGRGWHARAARTDAKGSQREGVLGASPNPPTSIPVFPAPGAIAGAPSDTTTRARDAAGTSSDVAGTTRDAAGQGRAIAGRSRDVATAGCDTAASSCDVPGGRAPFHPPQSGNRASCQGANLTPPSSPCPALVDKRPVANPATGATCPCNQLVR